MGNINELVRQLRDSNPDVRSGAVEALAKAGNPETVAPLITALQDEFESVRGRAFQGLKEIGSPTVPLLIVALENPDPQVRRKASCVLDNIGYELKDIGDFRAVETPDRCPQGLNECGSQSFHHSIEENWGTTRPPGSYICAESRSGEKRVGHWGVLPCYRSIT